MKMKIEKPWVGFASGVAAIVLIASAINRDAYTSGRMGSLLENIEPPHSGEDEVLPKDVRFILGFVRGSDIKSVRVSQAIADNRFIYQPLVESIFPAVVKRDSTTFVLYSQERLPADCTTLTVGKGIRIASCP